VPGNLTPLLRRVVLVGEAALGLRLDVECIGLGAVDCTDQVMVRLLGPRKPGRALGRVGPSLPFHTRSVSRLGGLRFKRSRRARMAGVSKGLPAALFSGGIMAMVCSYAQRAAVPGCVRAK
jgi:hypothetical protein